jgi:hypothetical protein
MPIVQIVENGRKHKKRRTYTAKQRAAGFGGKKHRKSGSRKPKRSASTSTLTPNRRHHRYQATGSRRWHRRHRNPSGGGLFGLPIPGIDLKAAAYIGAGMLSTRLVPNLVAKVWPGIPRTGYMGYAVDAGCGILTGMAVKLLTKNSAAAGQVVAGALGMVLFNVFNNELAPKIPGLSGLTGELARVGDFSQLGYVAAAGNGSRIHAFNPAMGF